jgi:hypothetical protein
MLAVALLALRPVPSPQPTRYSVFWTWFRAHSERLHGVRSSADPLLDSLGAALAKVHPNVTFEIGPAQPTRELVLSADRIHAAFPEVEALVAAAAQWPGWRIFKFRPRRRPLNALTVGGRSIDPTQVRFVLAQDDPGKVGILLFLDGYTARQRELYTKAAFLLLEESLGEYDMEARVGAIELRAIGAAGAARSRPDQPDIWLEFRPDDAASLDAAAASLRALFTDFGEPWLNRFSNFAAARDELVRTGQTWWAAAASLCAGDRASASRLIHKTIEGAPRDRTPYLVHWAQRHALL